MTELPVALKFALAALSVAAAAWDIRLRRIPNWLVAAGLLAGLAGNLFFSAGIRGAGVAAGGMAAAFAVYLPLYALRAAGAGDLKLAVAMGAIAGPVNWLFIFVLTAVLGGIFALVLVIVTGRAGRTFRNIGYILRQLARGRAPFENRADLDVRSAQSLRLPHGVAMALGAIGYLSAAALLAR
jgi:prepilin peptidase CpaA